jgi:hypothetical protein
MVFQIIYFSDRYQHELIRGFFTHRLWTQLSYQNELGNQNYLLRSAKMLNGPFFIAKHHLIETAVSICLNTSSFSTT